MNSPGSQRPLTRRVLAFLLLLLFVGLRSQVSAQSDDSKGTDFWLMFNENLGTPQLTLFITGDTNTTGTVSVPGLGFSTPFSVTANVVTSVVVPSGAQHTASDVVRNLGIHVTALAEVTVYGLNRVQFTTDAFLGLPTDILGTEYLVLSHENVNIVNANQFGIVAAVNGTVVSITPSMAAGARPAGVPFDINLNQGQTYQLRNTANLGDLSGTVITSTQPIAVFGSHQCANIPDGNTTACDHIVEQLPPTSTWGQSFVTMPLATRRNGDTFRFLAQNNGTAVSVNGTVVATLNRGQVHERLINGPASITSTAPILVAQFSNGSSFDGVTSDPFMMLIPPFEQFLGNYTITTPASGFATNFVNVVAPNSAVGSITLDGVPIPASAFTPIPGSAFSGSQRPVSLGSHNLGGPQPFGVFAYGFDSFDSYGYPGGLALGEVALVTTLNLTPETATNPVNTQHCVTARVADQNNQGLSGVRVDFSVTGAHTTTGFIFTDTSGNAQFCYLGTVAGTDTISAAVGALTDTASKLWIAGGMVCDIDSDQDVDNADLNLIRAGNGQIPSAGDRRDANGDGRINVADVRYCQLRQTPPPAH